jgi:putative phage-type endonuclease
MDNLQGTPAWFDQRCGKLTASKNAAAMAFLKGGGDSAERRNLKKKLVSERLTGIIVQEFQTAEMKWGIEQEAKAKGLLEEKHGWKLMEFSFVDHPTISGVGCSPDGMLMDGSALVEIKCPTSATMVEWLIEASDDESFVPEQYKPQMALQSACFGRIPVWFVAFDPRLSCSKIFARLYTPDPEYIEKIECNARNLLEEVERMIIKCKEFDGGLPAQFVKT